VTAGLLMRETKERFEMKRITPGLVMLGACLALSVVLRASDMVGIYGVVEKVVLEPSDAAPQRVQVWGAFALAEGRGSTYQAPQRGYLYYTCPSGQESICRNEWADLKSVAGKNAAIGFGMRYKPTGRVRKTDEKAASPDLYPIEMGVTKIDNPADRGSDTAQVIEALKNAVKQR
jgi:hypothetical protein